MSNKRRVPFNDEYQLSFTVCFTQLVSSIKIPATIMMLEFFYK